MPSIPVTATIVTVPSATASWIIPDWNTSPAASNSALRVTTLIPFSRSRRPGEPWQLLRPRERLR